MDADQFKQFMLAFHTKHQQLLERVLPLQAPSTSTEQSSANINANDFKTFMNLTK
jgi:hypothetical protein